MLIAWNKEKSRNAAMQYYNTVFCSSHILAAYVCLYSIPK